SPARRGRIGVPQPERDENRTGENNTGRAAAARRLADLSAKPRFRIALNRRSRGRSMHRRQLLQAGASLALISALTPKRAGANPDFDLGPPVNAKAPDIGSPRDFTGWPRTLVSLMGEKGLVLFFFRSADWCPFCQAQLMDLNTAFKDMEIRGYKLAGISYDSPEILRTFIERRDIGFTLISDPKSEIIDRY